MADKVAAAIRRATRAAQAAMLALDSTAVTDLTQIYNQAADEVRAAIAQTAFGQRVQLDQMRALLTRIESVLAGLASSQEQVLQAALEQAAQLGADPAAAPLEDGRQALAGASVQRVADDAVRFVREFRAADGLNLSDRLWRVNKGARDAVAGRIEQAVVQGWGADKAAQEFIMRGQAVPVATKMAQGAADVTKLMQGADFLQNPDAGALANVLRVMRTEVNRAHGEAYMASTADAPGLVGFRFLLSPRHPRPDICDLYARQNLHGLGAGVYPDRKSCPWPAHPNTLSFVVAVFREQLTPADAEGQETTLQALDRLGPEIRAGVLGPTKAGYFDQGLLSKGMVRSTVGAVRARLGRTT